MVLNLPTDEKGKRNRKTLSTGLSTDRNATKAKALLQTMIRAASAGEEVHGVKERVAAAATEDTEESWNTPHPNMLFSNYLEFWLQWNAKVGKRSLTPAIAKMSDRGLRRIFPHGKYA